MADLFKYPRGSEWRKWDLHVHSPLSGLNNQYPKNSDGLPDWEQFINKLEALKDISVLGITDYFSIDGYRAISDFRRKDKLKNFDLILPNIELRLDTFVVETKSKEINFHIIFSDELNPDYIEKEFLEALTIQVSGSISGLEGKRQLNKTSLVEVGKKIKDHHPAFRSDSDIEAAYKNITVSLSQVQELLMKDLFKRRFLLVLAAGEWSDIDWNQAYLAKKNFLQAAHILETGSLDTVNWALGKKDLSKEDFIKEFGTLKPCIHGSDAHHLDKICSPDNNKFCWIKANPTFEGLKQILYEPEERVYIGEEPPGKIDKIKIIKSLTLSSSNGWFEEDNILEFNENLISIIGGKGTGKTALLDLIAYASGSYTNGEKSFLRKAAKNLKGLKIKVEWEDGSPDEKEISDKLEVNSTQEKTRYLSQSFVEQLCSVDKIQNLRDQIENVIFQNIPAEDKANYIDFSDYKDAQLKVIGDKKARIVIQIQELNKTIFEKQQLINKKADISSEIKRIEENTEKLNKELEELSSTLKESKEKQENLDKLNKLIQNKSNVEKKISDLKSFLLKTDEIINKLLQYTDDFKNIIEVIRTDLEEIKVKPEYIGELKIIFYPENLEEIVTKRKGEISEEIIKEANGLAAINKEIKDLTNILNLEKSKQDKMKNINDQLNLNKKHIDSLNRELENVNKANDKIPSLLKQREKLFINFFELLIEEKNKLTTIYSPIMKSLEESTEKEENLFAFTVKFGFDLETMSERGYELIDHKRKGRFHNKSVDALREELTNLIFTIDIESASLTESNKGALEVFLNQIEKLLLEDENGDRFKIGSQLKRTYSEIDFYNWLYSIDYYSINYSLKFNDTELDNLSPGLKGVALLILYLELDKEDTRPILIDQPEENLDNRSVYEMLVDYFRKAKRRRQAIIITHNPNLVVNTDSEQIFVANFDRERKTQSAYICYRSGSLENTFEEPGLPVYLERKGIREHICQILEGGKEAFEKREQKYGFA